MVPVRLLHALEKPLLNLKYSTSPAENDAPEKVNTWATYAVVLLNVAVPMVTNDVLPVIFSTVKVPPVPPLKFSCTYSEILVTDPAEVAVYLL